jgi:hypothetical protein
MAVLTEQLDQEMYALDLQQVPLPASDAAGPVVEPTAPPRAVVDLGGQGGVGQRLTWPNSAGIVTISSSGGVVNVDLSTHDRPILLKQDVGQICGVSWTPDGTQLAFSLCSPGNLDVAGARPQLYVYAPSIR